MDHPAKNLLCFIALIPPDPIKSEIQHIKLQIKERYASSHSLNAPPHITLLSPFRLREENRSEVEKILYGIAAKNRPFQVQLNNTDTFGTRVIFIDVIKSPELEALQADIEHTARTHAALFDYKYDEKLYRPHITLAFKDLSPDNFKRAWAELKHLTYTKSFQADSLCLLIHNGKVWEMEKYFFFSKT